MRLAVMQPYFLPYIGYFQLMAAVDTFVVYDNIKYTKSGWINRNNFLQNGQKTVFSLPLRKDSDACHVVERSLALDFDRQQLLDRFRNAYRRAPFQAEVLPLLERIVSFPEDNLFAYIHHSIKAISEYIGLQTHVLISSSVEIDHDLRAQNKVLAFCQVLEADTYINAIGGTELYSVQDFQAQGITLKFLRSRPLVYPQYGQPFVPSLSILDVLMFNPRDEVHGLVMSQYDLE